MEGPGHTLPTAAELPESLLPDGGFVGRLKVGNWDEESASSDGRRSLSAGYLKFKQDISWEHHLDGDGWDAKKILSIASTIPQLKIQARPLIV